MQCQSVRAMIFNSQSIHAPISSSGSVHACIIYSRSVFMSQFRVFDWFTREFSITDQCMRRFFIHDWFMCQFSIVNQSVQRFYRLLHSYIDFLLLIGLFFHVNKNADKFCNLPINYHTHTDNLGHPLYCLPEHTTFRFHVVNAIGDLATNLTNRDVCTMTKTSRFVELARIFLHFPHSFPSLSLYTIDH